MCELRDIFFFFIQEIWLFGLFFLKQKTPTKKQQQLDGEWIIFSFHLCFPLQWDRTWADLSGWQSPTPGRSQTEGSNPHRNLHTAPPRLHAPSPQTRRISVTPGSGWAWSTAPDYSAQPQTSHCAARVRSQALVHPEPLIPLTASPVSCPQVSSSCLQTDGKPQVTQPAGGEVEWRLKKCSLTSVTVVQRLVLLRDFEEHFLQRGVHHSKAGQSQASQALLQSLQTHIQYGSK